LDSSQKFIQNLLVKIPSVSIFFSVHAADCLLQSYDLTRKISRKRSNTTT